MIMEGSGNEKSLKEGTKHIGAPVCLVTRACMLVRVCLRIRASTSTRVCGYACMREHLLD